MFLLKVPAIFSLVLLISCLQVLLITSFQPIHSRTFISDRIPSCCHPRSPHLLQAKEDENANDDRQGMEDAFESLDGLSSLEFGDLKEEKLEKTSIKASDDLFESLGETDSSIDENSSPEELNFYKEIVEELETEGKDGIYENIMGEMTSSGSSTSSKEPKSEDKKVLSDADGLGSLSKDEEETLTVVEISQDTDKLMKRALQEAMEEVTSNSPKKGKGALPDSILNDKEMMTEINAIFDRANEQLIESISDIKDEQAKMNEAANKRRSDSLKDEEQRLAEAEGSVTLLLDKVKDETLEVEKAMAELEAAQGKLLDDPLMKAVDVKSGGIVKTGALAGTLLFSLRTMGELFLLSGPNGPEHGTAAVIQGVIAVAFGAIFAFL